MINCGDQSRDAKVEQVDSAVEVVEHVRGLDVGMDHQLAMSIGDCFTHRFKSIEPFCLSGVIGGESPIDRKAIDEIHRQPWPPVGITTVDDPHDAGVAQAGQDPPFLGKPCLGARAGEVAADQLDCDSLLKHPVVTLSLDHRAHAAAGDLGGDLIRANALRYVVHDRNRPGKTLGWQQTEAGVVPRQQRLNSCSQRIVVAAFARNEGDARSALVELECCFDNCQCAGIDRHGRGPLLPALGARPALPLLQKRRVPVSPIVPEWTV